MSQIGSSTTMEMTNNQERPSGRKPRKSCDQCTNLKVGCTKEKPHCSRCVKRKTTCTYSMTRRPGRPGRNRQSQQNASTSSTPPEQTYSLESDALSQSPGYTPDLLDCNASSQLVSAPSSISSTHTIQGHMNPFDLGDSPSMHTWSDLGNFFVDDASFDNILVLQDHDMDPMTDFGLSSTEPPTAICGDVNQDTINLMAQPVFTNPFEYHERTPKQNRGSRLFSAAPEATIGTIPMNEFNWFPNVEDMAAKSVSECQCYSLVVPLMNKPPLTTQSLVSKLSQGPTTKALQATVADVQTHIKDVNSILDCQCSKGNGNLCMLLALVLFRLLGDYKSIATHFASNRDDKSTTPPPARSSLFRAVDSKAREQVPRFELDENLERVALQKVLGNLHSVQRVIKRLGSTFETAMSSTNISLTDSPKEPFGRQPDLLSTKVPAAVYETMEAELRTSYRALTTATLNQLKAKMEKQPDDFSDSNTFVSPQRVDSLESILQ